MPAATASAARRDPRGACALLLALLLATTAALAAGDADDAPTAPDDATRAAEEAETKRKLEAVRDQMRELERARSSTRESRASELAALRDQELEVARVARELRELDEELARGEARLATLGAEEQVLAQRLEAQREQVAALLRSAYALGRDGELRLLFAPERVGEVARVLGYHRYLQNDRTRRIRELAGELIALDQVRQQLERARVELAAARAAREAEATTLEQERAERRTLLASLEADLRDQRSRLTALGRDEAQLLDLLQRLRDAIADVPAVLAGSEPFASRRGRVPWPLAGRVEAAFGSTGGDGRVLEGLLIAGEPGREVRAVGHGRIAYADWLKGYGLLAIVDHGDGYMSLYAHNEVLLRDVGDWVEGGDPIATAGSSGGRREVALYFELRRDGRPFDPLPWLARR